MPRFKEDDLVRIKADAKDTDTCPVDGHMEEQRGSIGRIETAIESYKGFPDAYNIKVDGDCYVWTWEESHLEPYSYQVGSIVKICHDISTVGLVDDCQRQIGKEGIIVNIEPKLFQAQVKLFDCNKIHSHWWHLNALEFVGPFDKTPEVCANKEEKEESYKRRSLMNWRKE